MRRVAPFLLAVLTLATALPAGAEAMTVNTTGNDTTPGNGVCSLREAITAVNNGDSSTECGPVVSGGTTTVNLGAGTYALGGTQLQIAGSANIAIAGSNANNPAATVIDGGLASRILEVLAGAHASITGLEVTNGKSAKGTDAPNSSSQAGFGADGGGILNHGTLTLDHVQVIGNITGAGGNGADGNPAYSYGAGSSGAPSGWGGGIFNDAGASLAVTHSLVQGNQTGTGGKGGVGAAGTPGSNGSPSGGTGGDGAYAGSGGGIFNGGSLTIADSTIRANATGRGGIGGKGGKGVDGSDTQARGDGGRGGFGGNNGVSVKHNGGDTYLFYGGGGIWNANTGTIQVTSSTISGNNTGAGGNGGDAGQPGINQYGGSGNAYSGPGGGGGMGGGFVNAYGNATLTNVTVQGNFTGDGGNAGGGLEQAAPGHGGYGGGLQVGGYGSTSSNVLTHVTIAQNGLGAGGTGQVAAFRGLGAGISSQSAGTGTPPGTSLKNTIVSRNGAPASDLNCAQTAPTDQQNDFGDQGHDLSYPDSSCPGVNADPGLGALGDNGGPTQTMVPTSAAAVGVIPSASCVGPTDQRGYSRPGIGKSLCDIGAVETGPAPGTTATTTSLTSSANPSTTGQEVTYTATVSPAPGSGNISFTDGGTPITGCESVTTTSGQATCSVTYAAAGTHSIVASYGANGAYGASSSSGLNQIVQAPARPPAGGSVSQAQSVSKPHPPNVTAAASTSAARAGSAVGFSASAADPDPGDSLSYAWTFDDGAGAGGPAVSHAFATAGLHSATVTVRDLSGLTATAAAFVYVEALTVTKTADRASVPSAGRAGFTISLTNPGARPIALRSIIDALPAGLRYVAGSAKLDGAPITDPAISGRSRTLTWSSPVRPVFTRHPLVCVGRGAARRCHRRTVRVLGARIPLTIAANRTIRLHLVAVAPRVAGTYTNHATATSGPTVQVDTRAASARIRVNPPRRRR